MNVPLVLASASARRRMLMQQAGFDFRYCPANIDETPHPGEKPRELVLRLAEEKARTVAGGFRAATQAVVIGADTIVVAPGGEVFGKPADRQDFRAMFGALCGTRHQVLTGLAVVCDGNCRTALAQAGVTLRDASEAEMDAYWASGEPRDKAGGYGLQGVGAIFVRAINGSPSAVIGLPLDELERLLRESGVETWRSRGMGARLSEGRCE